jgi:hypothetical protein
LADSSSFLTIELVRRLSGVKVSSGEGERLLYAGGAVSGVSCCFSEFSSNVKVEGRLEGTYRGDSIYTILQRRNSSAGSRALWG